MQLHNWEQCVVGNGTRDSNTTSDRTHCHIAICSRAPCSVLALCARAEAPPNPHRGTGASVLVASASPRQFASRVMQHANTHGDDVVGPMMAACSGANRAMACTRERTAWWPSDTVWRPAPDYSLSSGCPAPSGQLGG